MSLARATLRHEWRRFLPALLSVAFAGLLMLVQLGLLMGMFSTVTVLVDSSAAELWVTAATTQSVDDSADIPGSLSALLRTSDAVLRSEVLDVREANWRSNDGRHLGVSLVGLTPRGAALTCPRPLRGRLCAALAEPGGVVVDRSEADKLGVESGATAEINGHRVRVLALSQGMRSIGSSYVFASRQTLRSLLPADARDADGASFVLADLDDGADAEHVQRSLQRLLPHKTARAWTREQLSAHSQDWWMRESGVGAGFVFSSALGLVIAIVITSQSLRGLILSQLREYATFRAIGVPATRLAAVVMEQTAWVGVAGTLLMIVLVLLIALLAARFYVPFDIDGVDVLAASGIGLSTAVISGLVALRELYRLQPAELLR